MGNSMSELYEGATVPVYEIVTDKNKIFLWMMGDMHLGHIDFQERVFKHYLHWVLKDDNRYILGMGDYLEAVIPTAMPQAMWEQIMTPEEQINKLLQLLEPVKDRIIGLLTGNHELRIYFKTNIDPTKLLCEHLGCMYLGHGGYLAVKVNDINYRIALFHGYGSAESRSYHLKKVIERAGVDDADIVAIGHCHQLHHEVWPRWRIINGRVTKKLIHGVRTGGFLRYPDYAKRLLYPPSIVGSPIVVLYAKRHCISVDLSGRLPLV